MKDYIEDRAIAIGEYMVETGATVRACAKKFGVSKSTVHKDVSERLIKINNQLFEKVRHVLDINMAERHIRGGSATSKKYEELRSHLEDGGLA